MSFRFLPHPGVHTRISSYKENDKLEQEQLEDSIDINLVIRTSSTEIQLYREIDT